MAKSKAPKPEVTMDGTVLTIKAHGKTWQHDYGSEASVRSAWHRASNPRYMDEMIRNIGVNHFKATEDIADLPSIEI